MKIYFAPSGKKYETNASVTVLEAARKVGADLDSVCGGRGICGRCQIDLSIGSHAKHGVNVSEDCLSPFSETEKRYAEKRGLKEGRRLGCCARILKDTVIDVPPESQTRKQIVRKSADERIVMIDPTVRLYYVTVTEPDMHNPLGDRERLKEALKIAHDLDTDGLMFPLSLLRALQKTLRKENYSVTVALYSQTDSGNSEVIAIYPGYIDRVYGLAIDIGSTTIAGTLCDLSDGSVKASAGIMNPQIRYGEDLMSRVSYAQMNDNGAAEMTNSVRLALNDLIEGLAKSAEIETSHILECVAVGNPVMTSLFSGFSPIELGFAPFATVTSESITGSAEDFFITALPASAKIFIPPLIAGHVGADAVSVAVTERPFDSEESVLIADVGTNAEIYFGNRSRLLAASSPTGPAFEGAQLSSGQRAADGAIERVRIDPITKIPSYYIIGSELCSDDPNFEKEIEKTGVSGICGSGVIEAVAEMYRAGVITSDGRIKESLIEETAHRSAGRVEKDDRVCKYIIRDGEPQITITQNDVRAVQLAKAALYAGCKLLMNKFGVEKPDRILLAGAFGSRIDPLYATALGMLPDCAPDKIKAVGNSAGAGARILLLNKAARTEIAAAIKKVEKIEIALEKDFQDLFVNAIAVPNKIDDFSLLETVLPMPERNAETPEITRGGRRGGRKGAS